MVIKTFSQITVKGASKELVELMKEKMLKTKVPKDAEWMYKKLGWNKNARGK